MRRDSFLFCVSAADLFAAAERLISFINQLAQTRDMRRTHLTAAADDGSPGFHPARDIR